MPPSTPKFDGTCGSLKGCGLVFDSANPHADCSTYVKREIAEYIGKEYTNGGDFWWTLERERQKTIKPPASLETNATDVDKEIFKFDVYDYVNHQNRLRANLESDFTLILCQCTGLTQMKIEGLPTWEAMDDSSDIIRMIKMMNSLSHQNTD